RVRDDPQSYLDLTLLAGQYIRKARQDGDLAAYDKAESALRQALKILPSHTPAQVGLAITVCARHQFAEGLRLAEAVYRGSPDDLDALSVIGDAHLELGHYADAERAVRDLERKGLQPTPPPVLARLARLAELKGETDSAERLLVKAVQMQRSEFDFPQAGGWYLMRLGEVPWGKGKFDEAARQLEAALPAHPRLPTSLRLLGP